MFSWRSTRPSEWEWRMPGNCWSSKYVNRFCGTTNIHGLRRDSHPMEALYLSVLRVAMRAMTRKNEKTYWMVTNSGGIFCSNLQQSCSSCKVCQLYKLWNTSKLQNTWDVGFLGLCQQEEEIMEIPVSKSKEHSFINIHHFSPRHGTSQVSSTCKAGLCIVLYLDSTLSWDFTDFLSWCPCPLGLDMTRIVGFHAFPAVNPACQTSLASWNGLDAQTRELQDIPWITGCIVKLDHLQQRNMSCAKKKTTGCFTNIPETV